MFKHQPLFHQFAQLGAFLFRLLFRNIKIRQFIGLKRKPPPARTRRFTQGVHSNLFKFILTPMYKLHYFHPANWLCHISVDVIIFRRFELYVVLQFLTELDAKCLFDEFTA